MGKLDVGGREMDMENLMLSIRINVWYISPRFTLVVFLNVGIYTIRGSYGLERLKII